LHAHVLPIFKAAYVNQDNYIINTINNNPQHISLIFSTSGHFPEIFNVPMSIYPASKCGTVGLTKSLRNEIKRLHLDIRITVCLYLIAIIYFKAFQYFS